MSGKLPVGWENRRNNLTEHDMKLVRLGGAPHASDRS
jgi:allantoicase